MLRYLKRLESRDLSLTTSMIPLGSCTIEAERDVRNGSGQLAGVQQDSPVRPAAPDPRLPDFVRATRRVAGRNHRFLAISLQPNAGSQANMPAFSSFANITKAAVKGTATFVFIPTSAHGTNPASAVMAGLEVVAVRLRQGRKHRRC